MKKISVRLDEYVYDRLSLFVKEEKEHGNKNISINKVINEILKNKIDMPKEISSIEKISDNLERLENMILALSKKQHFHFLVSRQHFVNNGFFENLNFKKDKCFKELELKSRDPFNE